jgi:large repetitive protein
MRLFARRTAALGAALLSALAIVAVSAGAASAASPTVAPTWSAQQTYQSLTVTGSTTTGSVALMTSVSCSSYGNCVAAGVDESSGGASPVIAIESNGHWGNPVAAPLPANGQTGSTALLTTVSCTTATSCVAVGAYTTTSVAALGEQAFASPFTVSGSSATFGTPEQVALPAGALSTTAQTAFLSGVSCAATCTAVGAYLNGSSAWTPMIATQGAGGAWTAKAVTDPAGASEYTALNAISCPSTGACEAVGTYGDASSHEQSWVVQITDGIAGTSQDVTVPGTATSTAEAPEAAAGIGLSLRDGLTGVSCPSGGACMTVGTVESSSTTEPEAVAAPITQGTVGTFTALPSSGLLDYVTSVSCWDASDCVAGGLSASIDGAGATATSEVNGTWSAPVAILNPSVPAGASESISLPEAVSCSSPGVCVMAGFSLSETGSGPPTGTETEGSFFAYSALPPTITTSKLPAAKVGVRYKATLKSSGGVGTSTWAVTAGSLPKGLTLNASTGVISGTPKTNGQSGFIVTASNAGPPSLSATAGISITVGAAASVHVAYSQISGHAAMLVLTCAGANCAGKLKLTDKVGKHTVTLASGHYSVKAGSTKVTKVKLNRAGAALLTKLGRVSGKLTLTPTGAKKAAVIKILKFRS